MRNLTQWHNYNRPAPKPDANSQNTMNIPNATEKPATVLRSIGIVQRLRGLFKKIHKQERVQCSECKGMGLVFNKFTMWQTPCKKCNQHGWITKPKKYE